jgi:hypothetical protein
LILSPKPVRTAAATRIDGTSLAPAMRRISVASAVAEAGRLAGSADIAFAATSASGAAHSAPAGT